MTSSAVKTWTDFGHEYNIGVYRFQKSNYNVNHIGQFLQV